MSNHCSPRNSITDILHEMLGDPVVKQKEKEYPKTYPVRFNHFLAVSKK